MKSKLVYILKDKYGYGKTAFYEYRGHEYTIHFCNNGCMDDMNIAEEHKKQQKMIDEEIEGKTYESNEWKYEGSADETLDLFFKEMEW